MGVKSIEHGLLRVVSLVFSFGSAYAIAEVFMPSDGIRDTACRVMSVLLLVLVCSATF